MIRSIEGRYHDGKVELLEPAPAVSEARVIVTFLPMGEEIKLADLGITPQEAAEMRVRLGGVVEDWEDPEMDIYDAL